MIHLVVLRVAALVLLGYILVFVWKASGLNVWDVRNRWWVVERQDRAGIDSKEAFIESLVNNMTISDLVLQLHLMFGDNLIGPNSDYELYDFTMRFSPESPVGVIHDLYSLNTSQINHLQKINLEKARVKIPFMHFGECLHGVGSFKQTMFPQSIGMSASFETHLVHRVGRAIASEARSIGIHACFSPVLDLGLDPRWGRLQEAWGEDKILTSHMGVAYASGLSKNGSWPDSDAVVPVMKHFAAHGSPQSGRNAAPFVGHGTREVLQDLMLPFKAAVDLGGVRGVMMAYNELDSIPAVVHPDLYQALEDWGFDGFTLADDTAMKQLQTTHRIAKSPADAIRQWFNAGGMIQFYDYSLSTYLNATKELVANGTVLLATLQSHVRKILDVKWDLGLFKNPYILDSMNPQSLVAQHTDIALEAAHKSIVLLKNDNNTLPLRPDLQNIKKIALIGPFADILNYGDYSGPWGQQPVVNSSTIRQSMLEHLEDLPVPNFELLSSWGANSWEYNTQNAIPPYLLSVNENKGGLLGTYFANTDFTDSRMQTIETPALDWGLFPPPSLPSNNFSAIWEGDLESPVDIDTNSYIGIAISPNSTAKLYIDKKLVVATPFSHQSTILSNILPWSFALANSTLPPPSSAPFTFRKGVKHHIRIEYQAYTTYHKIENQSSLNSQILLFWNLAPHRPTAADTALSLASQADIIVLALGAAWNSDGENADRATLGLPPSQDALAEAVFGLGKPIVLVLQGGRPFAIPEHYGRAAAVVSVFFPGQAGGRAVADVLFGKFNPGGRMPVSVPRNVGVVPVNYNYKPSGRVAGYVDGEEGVLFPFGWGLSYSTFEVGEFRAGVKARGIEDRATFSSGDVVAFKAKVRNGGAVDGSYVLQVYLLGRISAITQPVKQLVAFERVYLGVGEETIVVMELDVDRYLQILNRKFEWELEKGDYTFALLEHGGDKADTGMNVTLRCA